MQSSGVQCTVSLVVYVRLVFVMRSAFKTACKLDYDTFSNGKPLKQFRS